MIPNLSQLYPARLLAFPTNTATKVGWTELESGLGNAWTRVFSNENFNSQLQGQWTIYGILREIYPNCWLSLIHSKRDHTGDQQTANGRYQPFYYLRQWALEGGMDRYVSACLVKPSGGIFLEETRNYLLEHINAYLTSGKVGGMIFVHFQAPDPQGHQYGMGSSQWNSSVVRIDEILGEAINLFQPDIIFVVSDHGFDGFYKTTHSNAPYGVILSNLPLKRGGGIRTDFVPTVLDAIGIPVEDRNPELLGSSILVHVH